MLPCSADMERPAAEIPQAVSSATLLIRSPRLARRTRSVTYENRQPIVHQERCPAPHLLPLNHGGRG